MTGDVTSSVAPVESARVSFSHISEIEEPPICFEDILGEKDENVWLSAFAEEFDGLIDADAFRLVEVPKGANIVSGRWVNLWKTDGDGQVLKTKLRMAERGFSQSYGDDFFEVASPTVAPTTT